jgi:serine/threonine protein kinase
VLTERGRIADFVKVLDFGLVKPIHEGDDAGVTQMNAITGTPHYLSPEAIRGPRGGAPSVDARSDLYAVGAVGYFLLTGAPVFDGPSVVEVCSHHLHTRPTTPSERLGREVPGDLEAVVLQCLEKDPARRPESADALSRALAGCACLAEWGAAEARAWWDAHGDELRRRTREVGAARPATTGLAATVAVALERRKAG